MADVLFKIDHYVFSYRVAGICIQNNKVLLQKPTHDSGFSFPGGHVALGETNEETLMREFKEEIDANVSVGDLKWVGEIFFLWDEKPCHQICLYYEIKIEDGDILKEGVFMAQEQCEGRSFELEFHWIPIDSVDGVEVYPTNLSHLLNSLDKGVQHFVYKE